MKTRTHRNLLTGLALAFAGAAPLVLATASADAKPGHKAKITMEQARQTALARVAGKVKAAELEHENGLWIYSFEIVANGGKKGEIQEVNVNADTGTIVDVQTEKEDGDEDARTDEGGKGGGEKED